MEKFEVDPVKVAAYALMSRETREQMSFGIRFLAEAYGLRVQLDSQVPSGCVGLFNVAGQLLGWLYLKERLP